MLMKSVVLDLDIAFAQDVLEGLSRREKSLPSRYFYDAEGDRLFQAIMASPEYYLTDCEFEIFERQGDELATALFEAGPCELIELGSGDGLKTSLLLDALHRHSLDCIYRPVDISQNSLDLLERRLLPDRPWLNFRPIHSNYMDLLRAARPDGTRRVFMFLGSNMGNFTGGSDIAFLKLIRAAMGPHDSLLIGLDLKKDPAVIRAAYNDKAGHTSEFNLNLLRRINVELGADFKLEAFEHCPKYDPETGEAHSFLRSRLDQTIRISELGRSFHFLPGETIHTEVSQKYDQKMLDEMASTSGFTVDGCFFDSRGYFTDQVWK